MDLCIIFNHLPLMHTAQYPPPVLTGKPSTNLAPLLSLSHSSAMCFLTLLVSSGSLRGDGLRVWSLADLASTVRSRWVTDASTVSSQPWIDSKYCQCFGFVLILSCCFSYSKNSFPSKDSQTLSDIIKICQTSSNSVRHHQTLSDIIKLCQTSSKYVRHHQNLSDVIKLCQTSSNSVRHHQTVSDIIKICQTSSKSVRHQQTLSDIIKICQMSSNSVRHHQRLADLIQLCQTSSNSVRHHQTLSGVIKICQMS